MAYRKHYTIPFRTLHSNTLMTVNIYEDGYEGTDVIELIGADEPFETQEDSDEKWTTPIRTSTGNLRIVTNDEALIDALTPSTPEQMFVELIEGTTIKWQGFIQQQSFNFPLYDGLVEVEFPIISYLNYKLSQSLLETTEGYKSIADIIATICGDKITTVYLPNNELCGTCQFVNDFNNTQTSPVDLLLRINMETFKDKRDSVEYLNNQDIYNGIFKPNTYNDVMEAICKIFGWTLQEDGQSLLFYDIANNSLNPTYRRCEVSNLPASIPYTPEEITDISLCSTENNHTTSLPYKTFIFKTKEPSNSETVYSKTDKVLRDADVTHTRNSMYGCYNDLNVLTKMPEVTCYRYDQNQVALAENAPSLAYLNYYGQSSLPSYYGAEYGRYKVIHQDESEKLNAEGFLISGRNIASSGVNCPVRYPAIKIRPIAPMWIYGKYSSNIEFDVSAEVKFGDSLDAMETHDDKRYIGMVVKIGNRYLTTSGALSSSETIVRPLITDGKLSFNTSFATNDVIYDNIEVTIYTQIGSDNFNIQYILLSNLKIIVKSAVSESSFMKYFINKFAGWINTTVDLQKRLNLYGNNEYKIDSPFCQGFDSRMICDPNSSPLNMPFKYVGNYTAHVGLEGLGLRIYDKMQSRLSMPSTLMSVTVCDFPDLINKISIDDNSYHLLSRSRKWKEEESGLVLLRIENG